MKNGIKYTGNKVEEETASDFQHDPSSFVPLYLDSLLYEPPVSMYSSGQIL
jgi:hypothetical protein